MGGASPETLSDWVDVVGQHPLWAGVPDDAAATRAMLRLQCSTLTGQLAVARRSVPAGNADDPWQDPTLPVRVVDQIGWLAVDLPGGLSGAEVALLLVTPFLYETLWSTVVDSRRVAGPHNLAPSQDATPDRAAFERFAQSYPQLYRRAAAAAARGQRMAARDIGWWLLRRWVGRQPEVYQPATLADSWAAGVETPFQPTRLAELVRALRAGPGFLSRNDRPGALTAVAPDGVRERLVAYLLAVGHTLAIEAAALPDVIGEHAGISDPVSPDGLRATIRAARWERRGSAVALAAACAHPAVEVALRAHVDSLNQLLAEVHREAAVDESLVALRCLPTHVAADGLHPSDVDGVRAYQSAGVRFRLAEDRVQELLMGEQLYGDPALAIRELYQNSLDACRYRQARTEYLQRTAGLAESWAGTIHMEQGFDEEGRPFLDCVDNGIGMGIRELSDVFAQAGVRLSDLPEFLEEQLEWARLDPPVQLFPNSRFGIGVLSYFMLADEITVDTCRLGRDGSPGQRLRVSIAGPGSLFRIRNLGAGTTAGTRIRLHLRDGLAVSCVDTLRAVLWVAEFHTEARHEAHRHTWLPGVLSESAGPNQAAMKGDAVPPVVSVPELGVWWCGESGAVLADGLWAGTGFHGAVVNLSRDLAPRLSVDRTKILAYRDEDVERLLWQAVPALTAAGPVVLTYDWLYQMARRRPLIADVIFERALADGYRRWKLGDDMIDAAIAGCFLNDGGDQFEGADPLVEWRLTALAAAGACTRLVKPADDWHRVIRAKPTDALIMSIDLDGCMPWLDPFDTVTLAHLVRAARRIGGGVAEVAQRLETLGYGVEAGAELVGTDAEDIVLTSRDLNGQRPWLDSVAPVPLPHLIKGARVTGRSVRSVLGRLARLGFRIDVDPATIPIDDFEPADLTLTSRDLDECFPWLEVTSPVPLVHIVRAAQLLGRDATEVAARLAALGYRLPPGCEALRTEPDDLVLLSRDLDGASPWLDPAEPVSPIHLLRAAQRTGRAVTDVGARLMNIGLVPGVDPAQLTDVRLTADDLILISRDLDGVEPWLASGPSVSTVHLLRAAEAASLPLGQVAARLEQLGYQLSVRPEEIMVDRFEPDDEALISEHDDGDNAPLDPNVPVPAIHVLRVARQTGRDYHQVAARLTVLGYTVSTAAGDLTADQLESDDLVITSRELDGSMPWLAIGETVSLPHIIAAARRIRRPIREVAARFAVLGHPVDADLDSVAVDTVRSADLVAASTDLDGAHPWLEISRPVPMAHLIAAARQLRRTPDQVATRLAGLGYTVPDLDLRLPRARPGGV